MFKIDEQIKRLPKCQNDGCDNDAWVCCGGKWLCGECTLRFNEEMNKMIFERIKK